MKRFILIVMGFVLISGGIRTGYILNERHRWKLAMEDGIFNQDRGLEEERVKRDMKAPKKQDIPKEVVVVENKKDAREQAMEGPPYLKEGKEAINVGGNDKSLKGQGEPTKKDVASDNNLNLQESVTGSRTDDVGVKSIPSDEKMGPEQMQGRENTIDLIAKEDGGKGSADPKVGVKNTSVAIAQGTIKDVEGNISLMDKAKAVKLILSHLDPADINLLRQLVAGGLTSEEKQRAVKMAYARYDEDEIRVIKNLYRKYVD